MLKTCADNHGRGSGHVELVPWRWRWEPPPCGRRRAATVRRDIAGGGEPASLTVTPALTEAVRWTRLTSSLLVVIAVATCTDAGTEPFPAGAVSGEVTAGGEGLAGVTVSLSDGSTTTTTIGGVFRFDGVEPGTYAVSISGYPAGTSFPETSLPVTVAGRVTVTVAFQARADSTDRAALVALYEATDGPNWVNNENWLTDGPLGEWYGVSVGDGGRVTMLDLAGEWDGEDWTWRQHGLAGRIPPELRNLTELQELELHHNRLTGPVPSELGTLSNLTHLSLHNNDLTGEIPAALGNLANLRWLFLQRNALTGPIPPELGKLTELQALEIDNNRLMGSIPPALGNLANLRWLSLQRNALTGPIPSELGNLVHLQWLELAYNSLLTGRIPPELGGLASLRYLSLSGTRLLEGSIPPELGSLTSLTHLYLDRTGVGGPLPPELGSLSQLKRLSIGWSGFTGPIPSELGNLRNLEVLSLPGNYLGGPIPPELGNLSSLTRLDLGYNEFLSGEIPASLGNLTSLTSLRLHLNLLSGPIPPEFGNLTLLESLALFGNQLTGPIPPELGDLEPLESLSLYDNQLTGPVPESFTRLQVLESLKVHNNALSGPLPDGMGALGELQELWVGNNPELSGPLPADLARLRRLESFKAGGTGLCAPDYEEFLEWLAGVPFHRISRCKGAAAYLTQSVQSRTDPVPLIAGKPALLRAFVASPNADGDAMPAARATFYLDGSAAHEVEIEPARGTIPGRIEESEASLERSINADVPGWLVQRGLEFVVDVDPAGSLDPTLGVTGRMPSTGRMAVDVVELQDLQLTVVPFLHETEPDSSIMAITEGMADDPATHPMLEEVRVLLPVGDIDLELHDPVLTSDGFGFQILSQTEVMRLIEGRPGYWLGMQGPVRLGLLGVAYNIPSWSAFSQPLPSTVAHEIGHNMGLWHAPCGGAGGPDPLYPHPTGLTASWGYDMANRRLVSPYSPDLMSYCGGQWIGDYHRANALRHRTKTEASTASPARIPSLVVWGGLDGDGQPYLEPAFLTDAMPTLPPEGRDFTLRATTEGGREAFALRFDMPSTHDAEDGRTVFVFSVPVNWTGALESIVLLGNNGSAVLNRDTDRPFRILKDRATGQVRAFLRGRQPATMVAADATGVAVYETLFSAGIPDSN